MKKQTKDSGTSSAYFRLLALEAEKYIRIAEFVTSGDLSASFKMLCNLFTGSIHRWTASHHLHTSLSSNMTRSMNRRTAMEWPSGWCEVSIASFCYKEDCSFSISVSVVLKGAADERTDLPNSRYNQSISCVNSFCPHQLNVTSSSLSRSVNVFPIFWTTGQKVFVMDWRKDESVRIDLSAER